MVAVAGSLRKLTVDGVSYNVAADANVSEIITQFENSMIPTSGAAMRKMMKRVPTRESVVLITDGADREALISVAEGLGDVPISYTNAAGDTYRCQGIIEIENNETEENRTTVQILPSGVWTAFLA